MELLIKKGQVYHIELNSEVLPQLKALDNKEDYGAFLSWQFLPSGLPDIRDINCYFGFEYANKTMYLDGYSDRTTDNPMDSIRKFWAEALDTLIRRGIFAEAIELYQKELEEDIN